MSQVTVNGWQPADPEVARLRDRVLAAEAALSARIDGLEHAAQEHRAADHTRRDRIWILVLGLTTGVVAPLLVTTLITFLHIRATR